MYMANIITYIYEKTKKYHTAFFIAFISILFIIAAYYVYQKTYVQKKKEQQFADVANSTDRKPTAEIFMFHVDWCPHCLKAKPEWEQFKRQYDNTEINGYLLRCYDIDCTDDSGTTDVSIDTGNKTATGIAPTPTKIADIIRKFGIESYPTIKMVKDDYTVDFDAKITKSSLDQFVHTVLK